MSKGKGRKKSGLPPGQIIFTGNRKVGKIHVHYLQYDATEITDTVLDNHSDIILPESPDNKVDWYDMRGIHDTSLIQHIGSTFGIHPLVLEDVADVHQRPKFDEYDNGNFISVRALQFNSSTKTVSTEQVTIYFKTGFVATFQETDTDLFDKVRLRLHGGKGKIRMRGADYLAYALVDVLVDDYYVIMEDIEEQIEALEGLLVDDPGAHIKGDIHQLKKALLVTRKSIMPLREAISRFAKTDSELVHESSKVFIRDLYDHTIQIMDMVETYRDMLNGLQDLFLSEVSFRMNKVMQLLTLISTIFIPLTFLAGIYGMNFQNMPELQWTYGYFGLLGLMFIIFILLLIYFKRKNWLG